MTGLHGLDRSTLDDLTDDVLDALAREEAVGPAALLLLLRRYASGARPDVADALGGAFARELDRQARGGCHDDPEAWLTLFSEGAAASDDERLARAATALVPLVRRRWSIPDVDVAMRALEACLLAANVPEARDLAAAAIDALERGVKGAYQPGAGMSHQISRTPFLRGTLPDQVHSASALLTAFALSDRLPYAMLADELMQSVLHAPVLGETVGAPTETFTIRCLEARVYCRLAVLHNDEEYRRTAILAVGTDYASEAARTLSGLAHARPALGVEAAPFALALAEWLNLQ